jgi:hypothetical protein
MTKGSHLYESHQTLPRKVKPSPIETLQKTASASRLNCWLQRRLKFFFRFVQGIAKPPAVSAW